MKSIALTVETVICNRDVVYDLEQNPLAIRWYNKIKSLEHQNIASVA